MLFSWSMLSLQSILMPRLRRSYEHYLWEGQSRLRFDPLAIAKNKSVSRFCQGSTLYELALGAFRARHQPGKRATFTLEAVMQLCHGRAGPWTWLAPAVFRG